MTIQLTRPFTEMSDAERAIISGEMDTLIAALSPELRAQLKYKWEFWRRPDQIRPPGGHRFWYTKCGRGWGKTRVGAEETREAIKLTGSIALVGPTTQDIRKFMIEGVSGLHSVFPPDQRPHYEPSKIQVTFHNGAIAGLYTAEEPLRLRGPQHGFAWLDEPASFVHGKDVMDNLRFGLRLGRKPWAVLTGTPKPAVWLREFAAEPVVITTRGTLYDNIHNLAESFIEDILGRYEGTRLGRQEVHGEDLDDIEGALWQEKVLDRNRLATFDPADPLASINAWLLDQGRKPIKRTNVWRTIVAVDPPGETAECGIVVVTAPTQGRSGVDHAVVLEDASLSGPPERWGKQVASTARRWNAERVYVESNQGGDMTRATIHAVDPTIRVEKITAKISKGARAEPVSALYERGLVHHAGFFPLLESQMVSWVPGEGKSPDRIDACIHGIASLLIARSSFGSTVQSAVDRRI